MGGCRKMFWKLKSLGYSNEEAYRKVGQHLARVQAPGKIAKIERTIEKGEKRMHKQLTLLEEIRRAL